VIPNLALVGATTHCPAIEFQHHYDNLKFLFKPLHNEQLDWVDLHYIINQDEMKNVRMSMEGATTWKHDIG
jgi:hypothetical protein